MALRRQRNAPFPKLAPVAGLMLYTGGDVWSDWTGLVFAEKDLDDCRVQAVGPGKPDEDMLVLNPEQRLPALADRELMLTGARVISEYLDERYPHPRFMSTDPAARAKTRMALDRFEQELFPALVAAQLEAKTKPGKLHKAFVATVAASGRWFPTRGHFLGVDYGLADTAWAVWLRGANRLGIKLPEATQQYAEKLAARKAIAAYFKAR